MSRFFVGCASATFASTVPLLINEIAYPTHRGIANALFMCGWYVGGTIAAFIVSGKTSRLFPIIRSSTNLEPLLPVDIRHTKHGRQHGMAYPNNPTTLDSSSCFARSHLGTRISSLAHLQRPRRRSENSAREMARRRRPKLKPRQLRSPRNHRNPTSRNRSSRQRQLRRDVQDSRQPPSPVHLRLPRNLRAVVR